MARGDDEIVYHHGEIDPTDYQVDDVLLSVASGNGLQKGGLYATHAVARCKTPSGVVTAVTVLANGHRVEICPAEPQLRRTRVLAEVNTEEDTEVTHSFPDFEDYEAWCALTGVAPERVHGLRYVEADRPPPRNARFTAMCVPGELDDGSDSTWYVYDMLSRTSDKVGTGKTSRVQAISVAREANRTWVAQQGENDE